MAEQISDVVVSSDVLSFSLRDLGSSTVPMQHFLELKGEKKIFHRCKCMPPKHNKIVKTKLKMMLEAGFVTSMSSAWSFPVVFATKKTGNLASASTTSP